jgi:hypothetical protein
VTTPNGGYHLYFRVAKDFETKMPCLPNAPSVEVKSKQLTAGGSYKDGKPYVLHGDLEKIPSLPKFIEGAICAKRCQEQQRKTVLAQKKKSYTKPSSLKKDWEKPSWAKIVEWMEEDNGGMFLGRNDRAFKLASKAKSHKYTFDETLNELLNDATVNSLPEREIRDVVKSVYKYNR